MISMLKGEVEHIKGSEVTVMVGGVGYLVRVPSYDSKEIKCGAEVCLYTAMIVREDALKLYGFLDPGQREVFLLLLNVTGVGPKIALNIVSQVDLNRFLDEVVKENIPYLCSLPGIGKKSAQRIVFDLKERISKEYGSEKGFKTGGIVGDAIAALMALGYSEAQAARAVDGIKASTVEDLVRLSLKALMK